MKNINLKFILFICFFALLIILISAPNCFADQELENLEYVVKVNSDGSMNVTEKWDLNVYDVNTIYKDFNYPENKFSNVKVIDTTNGRYA